MVNWLYDAFFLVLALGALALLFRMILELIDVVCGWNTVKFVKKIKKKLTQNNDAYKDFVRTTNSYGRVVELPFSVVQPLLRDDSPMIVVAQSDRLAIKDENCRNNNIYIKLSKKDYNEYIKFLEQKKINKRNLKKTEDTLAATQLINKELKRINDEAMESVAKETEKIKNITESCEHLSLEEVPPKVDALTSKIDTVITYVLNDGMEWELKPVVAQPEKFDQELFNKIWNGSKVIIIRDEYERGIFNACHFDNVICYRGTAALITDPLFARYLCNDNEWIVSIATPFLVNSGVNIIDLAKRCPDFTAKFKQRIQNEGIRYDRL